MCLCVGEIRLVITDVDGTITRTDVLGHILPRVGLDWSHAGITRLFSHIRANGYNILFLSSRAIPQVAAKRSLPSMWLDPCSAFVVVCVCVC